MRVGRQLKASRAGRVQAAWRLTLSQPSRSASALVWRCRQWLEVFVSLWEFRRGDGFMTQEGCCIGLPFSLEDSFHLTCSSQKFQHTPG